MSRMRACRAWIMRLVQALRGGRQEQELYAELQAHLALHIDENLRAGMSPAEARRVAHARLGGVEQVKERCREIRPFHWLDVKLGLRMLRKSWGLTLVGGLAMTLAIGVGTVVSAVYDLSFRGTLPLDDGDRVVALQTWDDRAHRRHDTSLRDYERWRDTLRSVEDVGTSHTIERTLVSANGPAEPVSIAEITASGFQLAGCCRCWVGRSSKRMSARPPTRSW